MSKIAAYSLIKKRKEMQYDILMLSEMYHLSEGQEMAAGKWSCL